MMMHVAWEWADEERAVRINEGETLVIGRARACHVACPHPSLSKRHAQLARRGHALVVRDLGSRNGVRVNGRPVTGAVLEDGDVVECGRLRLVARGIPARPPEEELEASGFALLGEPEPAPALCLRVVHGGPAHAHPLVGERVVLGSDPTADVVLSARGVSRRHAELVCEEGEWRVRDLGARNGVFVNGARVEVRDLRPGDLLEVGLLRLRLEPAPPPGLLDSVVLRFGRQPRSRRLQVGAAALLLALLGPALGWSLGGQQARAAEQDPHAGRLEAGLAALAAGRYDEAARQLASVKRAAFQEGRLSEASQVDPLLALAVHWSEQPADPLAFDWARAADLLERAARREPELPADLRAWLDAERPRVALNLLAYQGLAEADAALSALRAADRLPAALQALRTGLAACEAVDPRSLLTTAAAERRSALRATGLAALEAAAQAGQEATDPDWNAVRARLEQAAELADESAARARIQAGLELCRINERETAAFGRAWTLLQGGAREDAVRLLSAINPRARVSARARAVLARLRAEADLEAAGAAYRSGDDRLTLERLDRVCAAGEGLPAEVATRAAELRRRCLQAVNGLELARGLIQAGALDEAEEELSRLLEREPDPGNRFRRLAEEEAAHLAAQRRAALRAALERGEAALAEAGSPVAREEPSVSALATARARAAFREARDARGVGEPELERIRAAVRPWAERLSAITADLRTGRSAWFAAHAETCQLLLEWLPAGAPERSRAERTLGELQRELERGERRGLIVVGAR